MTQGLRRVMDEWSPAPQRGGTACGDSNYYPRGQEMRRWEETEADDHNLMNAEKGMTFLN